MAEGARLESVYTLTGIGGSNPSLSASILNTIHQHAMLGQFTPRSSEAAQQQPMITEFWGEKVIPRLIVESEIKR